MMCVARWPPMKTASKIGTCVGTPFSFACFGARPVQPQSFRSNRQLLAQLQFPVTPRKRMAEHFSSRHIWEGAAHIYVLDGAPAEGGPARAMTRRSS